MNKCVFIGLFFWSFLSLAQEQDSLKIKETALLNEVLLTSSKLNLWALGSSVVSLDSALKQNTHTELSQLLSSSSHIRIRSYGLGGLASSSIRGAGASHTLLQWNGVTLNQSTTGQFDLTLIPTILKNLLVACEILSYLTFQFLISLKLTFLTLNLFIFF